MRKGSPILFTERGRSGRGVDEGVCVSLTPLSSNTLPNARIWASDEHLYGELGQGLKGLANDNATVTRLTTTYGDDHTP